MRFAEIAVVVVFICSALNSLAYVMLKLAHNRSAKTLRKSYLTWQWWSGITLMVMAGLGTIGKSF